MIEIVETKLFYQLGAYVLCADTDKGLRSCNIAAPIVHVLCAGKEASLEYFLSS